MTRRGTWLAALVLGALLAGGAAAAPVKPAVISLADLRAAMKKHQGHVLVVHVWASWCAPCVHELPLVARLVRDARARGIEVYSVSLDSPRAAARVAQVLDRDGGDAIDRLILRLDDQDAVIAQLDPGWEGEIPAFFAYDPTGKLRRSHVGEMTQEKFERLVAGLAAPPIKK
jgi:cytochrome c biogenesis protein CcmG/thiol:disulfide interchange protein DsbE